MGPVDPEILWLRANKSAMTQNWLPRQRPLRNWKKWTGFTIFSSHKYLPFGELIVKISPVDPEIALLNLKKRKKLTQAKYIARSAGLPSGLNYINYICTDIVGAIYSTCIDVSFVGYAAFITQYISTYLQAKVH